MFKIINLCFECLIYFSIQEFYIILFLILFLQGKNKIDINSFLNTVSIDTRRRKKNRLPKCKKRSKVDFEEKDKFISKNFDDVLHDILTNKDLVKDSKEPSFKRDKFTNSKNLEPKNTNFNEIVEIEDGELIDNSSEMKCNKDFECQFKQTEIIDLTSTKLKPIQPNFNKNINQNNEKNTTFQR